MTNSEKLVEQLLPVLIQDGLVLSHDVEKYRVELATGKIKSEDWLMLAENTIDQEEE